MNTAKIEEFIAGLPFEFWVGLGGVCLLVIVAGAVALLRDRSPTFALVKICTHCGCEGLPRVVMPGSRLTEVILLFTFLVPGIFYGLWRDSARREVCPVCGSPGMVPLQSPRGRALRQGATQLK